MPGFVHTAATVPVDPSTGCSPVRHTSWAAQTATIHTIHRTYYYCL
jgi:hypothetical protein